MAYIDGFVAAVPNENRQKFIENAKQVDAFFIENGATRVVECWGDDVPEGKTTDFRRAVKAESNESVIFSWVEWPDKQTRQAAMQKMSDDPRMKNMQLPFDGQRMIYGGFENVFELKK